jgi:Fe-S cluster biogenesis protein NfuA
MFEEVQKVIETEIRPLLMMEGGDIDLISVDDGIVKVRLKGACGGCPMSALTLTNFVETMLKKRLLDVKRVVNIDGGLFAFGFR